MNKKIKVLMVGLLPTDIEKVDGGVVAVVLNLLSSFSKMEQVDMIFVSYNLEIKSEIIKRYSGNIKIHYLPYTVPFKLIDYFFNRKSLNRIIQSQKPDLIHIQEVTPHILRFLRFPKDRIVLTQHGIMSEEYKYAVNLRDKLQSLFKGFVERNVFPLFNNVIFISDYNKNLFPRKSIVGEKIYNPVNPIFFTKTKVSGQMNSISYVGRINKNKNLTIVLRARARLKEKNIIFTLHVVGGYKDNYYEGEVNTIVNENDLSGQVIFYGWQTQEQILQVHEKCRIFVLPSQQETMPVVVGEAMALGKVVVASNVGAVSEMVTDKISGFLFERNDLDQLCSLLKQLHNNAELIETTSVNAMREAREKFHPDSIASKTYEFYSKVLGKARTKRIE
jgi:glycosyltransferase involved in cell wall biosynthesis